MLDLHNDTDKPACLHLLRLLRIPHLNDAVTVNSASIDRRRAS
ncbi:hypothetical protein Q5741_02430 [Paenibacillus sp. JX-17]|uniref:Uncharacterized protein n=1 Tax=Paenibacillus lacisoli TaxID=3064525 RepID=A0ABT9C7M8_9BACL|nr:hypothetical protein [Paenibacillus sp. JX-17]MDO7905269.1 hypothetical protein [Paenibacillus sp. JX-17]